MILKKKNKGGRPKAISRNYMACVFRIERGMLLKEIAFLMGITEGGVSRILKNNLSNYFKTINKPDSTSKIYPKKMFYSVKYKSLHDWVRKNLGIPNKCDFCENTNSKIYDWANKSGNYLKDLTDWIRLCRKCHRAYDVLKGLAKTNGYAKLDILNRKVETKKNK